jgi:hypothetical protein
MMCLGWSTKPTCAGRPSYQIGGQQSCPDITWFWLTSAGVLLLGLFGGKGKKEQ